MFSRARSLDVDVIYDLMIHDLDILLTLVKEHGDGSESAWAFRC